MVGVCGAFGGAAWGLMKHVDKKIDNLEAKIDKLSDCFASYAERMADRVGNIEGRLQIPFDKSAQSFNKSPSKPHT